MPNYSLVASSQFNPFSYQELLAPVQEMSNYHEKLADEYDKLSSQADILEAMGTDDRDKRSGTYNRFKAYSDALRAEADNLFRNGLNGSSRQRLSDLRRRYNQEIVPIQNAWNKRQEEADMQMKAQLQHPELRFTRDARSTSLDEYIANPAGGYGVVNLNNIAAQMSAMAQNLAKQINSGAISREDVDEFTYNMITQRGFDPNFVSEWIRNPEVSPTLTNMMNQVLKTNGLSSEEFLNSPNSASILNEAIGAAQMGAWSSVGETTVTPRDDFAKQEAYKNQLALNLYTAKKQIDAQAAAQAAMREEGNIPLFFDNIISPDMEGEAAVKAGEKIDKVFNKIISLPDPTGNGTGYYALPVKASGTMSGSYNIYPSDLKNGDKNLIVSDRNGEILSRQQFIYRNRNFFKSNNGKTDWKNVEKTLGNFYDSNIGSHLKTMAYDPDNHSSGIPNPHVTEVQKKASEFAKGNAPYQVKALELRFGENRSKNGEVLEGMIPSLRMNDKYTFIKEITHITKDGSIETKKDNIKANEFLDDKNKSKSIPLFYRVNTRNGKNGIIMKMGGKSYWIPGERLGDVFRESNIDIDTMEEAYQMKKDFISKYGEAAYWADPNHQDVEDALNNAGAASVRNTVAAMGSGYGAHKYNTYQTNADKPE